MVGYPVLSLQLCRSLRVLALLGLVLGIAGNSGWAQTGYGLHTPKDSPKKPKTETAQTERRDSTGSTTPTRWSQTRAETEGRRLETRTLETLGVNGGYEPSVEIEEETTEVDSQTTRVVRRLFARDSDGRRKAIELTEEEHRKLPGSGLRVVRTTSKPDLNGTLQLTRQVIEQSTQLSPAIRRTGMTVLQPDVNGGLTPAERIDETRQEKETGLVIVERTHLLPDGNNRWEPYETREGVIHTQADGVRTEEQVYRRDANRQLSLAEKTVTKEWKDAEGAEHQTTEVYSNNIAGTTQYGDGRLHLDRRLRLVRRTRPDGSQQTIQEFEQRNIVAPSGPLRVTERVVEFSRAVGQGETQTRKTVQGLDANGRYKTIIVLQGNEGNH